MLNNITLVGRIVKDPELKQTQNGVAYLNFAIAVERDYAGADGNRITDFLDCKAWKGTAEFIAKWFKKGSWIGLTGSMQTDSYTDKDGNNRKAVYCNAKTASFVGSKDGNSAQQTQTATEDALAGFKDVTEEDIPF